MLVFCCSLLQKSSHESRTPFKKTCRLFFYPTARHEKPKCLAVLFYANVAKEKKMERLICAVLLKAVQDWENPKKRSEIEEFLNSEWFNELVEEGLRLRPEVIRSQVLAGSYKHLDIRAAYR